MNRIVCVGQRAKADESAGLLVRDLLADRELPPGVEVLDGSAAEQDLFKLIGESERLVFVDSVLESGNPGEVRLIRDKDQLIEHFNKARSGIELDACSVWLDLLTGESPPEMILVGIEPPLDRVALWRAAEMGLVLAEAPSRSSAKPAAFGWTA